MGIGLGEAIAFVLLAGLSLSIIAAMVYGTILLVRKAFGKRGD